MLALALAAALVAPDAVQLPPNVTVASRLLVIVTDAIRASPTLREQFVRIGRNRWIRVHLDIDAAERQSGVLFSRAHTDIKRFQYGLIVAAVHLVSTNHAAELIAHELEHVHEFAEGTNYRAEAARLPRRVWQTGPNTFESARALQIERIVAAEIAGAVAVANRD